MNALEQKFQVFISSTYQDLISERNVVSLAVLRSSDIPAGMELSSGANERTISVIYKWIDSCDIFVLIIGGRYGAISPSHGLSYTNLEFNYARQKGIPIITMVLTDKYLNNKVIAGKIQPTDCFERVNSEKLTSFRHDATSEHYCSIIDDFSEFEPALFRALSAIKKQHSLGGWVRRETCLAVVADSYSHYIDLYLSIMTRNKKIDDEQIISMLRAMQQVIEAVISPNLGWIDVVIPAELTDRDRPHLLITDVVNDNHWLKVRYSSVPRTNIPTLIPMEVHGEPWRGSGVAFRSGHFDYVGNLSDAFSRRKYHFSPAVERKIRNIYLEWNANHYFSSLLAICIKDVESGASIAVINFNFRLTDALGKRPIINPELSARIMSIVAPSIRVLSKVLKQK